MRMPLRIEERTNRAHTRNGVLICIPDLMVSMSPTSEPWPKPNLFVFLRFSVTLYLAD